MPTLHTRYLEPIAKIPNLGNTIFDKRKENRYTESLSSDLKLPFSGRPLQEILNLEGYSREARPRCQTAHPSSST